MAPASRAGGEARLRSSRCAICPRAGCPRHPTSTIEANSGFTSQRGLSTDDGRLQHGHEGQPSATSFPSRGCCSPHAGSLARKGGRGQPCPQIQARLYSRCRARRRKAWLLLYYNQGRSAIRDIAHILPCIYISHIYHKYIASSFRRSGHA